MRLVQIGNTLATSDGGPARNSFELNLALNRLPNTTADLVWVRGDIDQSVVKNYSSEESPLPVPGPRKVRLRQTGDRSIGLLELMRTIRRADFVIVHGYYLPWIPVVAFLCKVLRTPYVLTPHGALTDRQLAVSKKKKSVYEFLAGRLVRAGLFSFVTGSELERDQLRSTFPRQRSEYGGVGTVLPERYKAADPLGQPLRLLSVSRLAEKKRIDLSIDAVSALSRRGIECILYIAGSGPNDLVGQLLRRATDLGIESRVSFVGEVSGSSKTTAYLNADFFLLPSEDENFGIGLAEAASHGLPIVCSTAVASAHLLSDRGCLAIENPTGESLADSIIDLSDEHSERQIDVRREAIGVFSWSAVATRWASIFMRS